MDRILASLFDHTWANECLSSMQGVPSKTHGVLKKNTDSLWKCIINQEEDSCSECIYSQVQAVKWWFALYNWKWCGETVN